MPITDLTGTTWQLNGYIPNCVPDGSSSQATQVLNYELKPVSCYTKVEGWVDASNLNITDLTGTKWYFNTTPTLSYGTINYSLNFTSNAQDWTLLVTNSGYNAIYYGNTMVYSGNTAGWYSEAYRTIEITGGTAATNSILITWLKQNAQLWSSTLKPIRYFIKKTGSGVTDLTGTTWQFNEVPTVYGTEIASFSLNFDTTFGTDVIELIGCTGLTLPTSGQVIYNNATTRRPALYRYGYVYPATMVGLTWGRVNDSSPGDPVEPDDSIRTITITGGDDATNADLIAWLQANATLISGGQTGTYLQPVVLLQKVEEEVIETPTVISFKITYNTMAIYCEAEEGMTWHEWVNSEYNTGNASEANDSIYIGPYTVYNVTSTDVINANTTYHAGGGSN